MLRVIMRATMKHAEILVIGQGAAGLCAAISAKEAADEAAVPVKVTLVEAQSDQQCGGNTRWSPSNIRLKVDHQVEPGFVNAMLEQSGGRAEAAYFEQIASQSVELVKWLESMGVQFQSPPYYLARGPARIQPIGGGASLLKHLTARAVELGVQLVHELRMTDLQVEAGRVVGMSGRTPDQTVVALHADAVVLGCGGFEGNARMLAEHLGQAAAGFRLISPGTAHNDGAGMLAALAIGAQTAGDFSGAHAEPIDARSQQSAPVVLIYPYGVVVNALGQRFFDEGAGLMHETWEQFAHDMQFNCPGGTAYVITDASLRDIPDYQRAIRSEQPPIEASSLEEMAGLLGLPQDTLLQTVKTFNAACRPSSQGFDATVTDGLACYPANQPPKTNWALALQRPPFLAWPLVGALVYTLGGLKTDLHARVLGPQGPITGLYAAGEITGHFYGLAPNSVAMLRALIYGRIAGRRAFEDLEESKMS